VGSTKTDRSLGTVEIPHEGPEECKFGVRNGSLQNYLIVMYSLFILLDDRQQYLAKGSIYVELHLR
jgi:hypothetical protein